MAEGWALALAYLLGYAAAVVAAIVGTERRWLYAGIVGASLAALAAVAFFARPHAGDAAGGDPA